MFSRSLRRWLPIAVGLTLVCGGGYGIGQQALRRDANQPQVRLAHGAAARLEAGAPPTTVLPTGLVEISTSPAPWMMVYNRRQKLVAETAVLDSQPVGYATAALFNVAPGGQKAITWQPRPGVRSATVIVGYRDGWVVAGRSLREVEQATDRLLLLATLAWVASLLVSMAVVAAVQRRRGYPGLR